MKYARSLLVLIGLTSVLVSACGRELPASAMVGTSQTAPAERQAPLDISGMDLDGAPLDLADLRGKVVVLNGWASWCAPCREEIPDLVDFATSVKANDVAVVGVNVGDEPEAARAFAKDYGITYPSIADPDAVTWGTIPGIPPKSLPSTVVLDRDGRIAATIVGTFDVDELRSLVSTIEQE